MATQSPAAPAAQLLAFGGRDLPDVFTVAIAHRTVRCYVIHGLVHVNARDLLEVLGYTNRTTLFGLKSVFMNHGLELEQFIQDLACRGFAFKCINEAGLRKVCEVVKPRRTEALRAWLAEGGMQRVSESLLPPGSTTTNAAGFPTDQAVMGGKYKFVDVDEFDDANQTAPQPSSNRAMSPDLMEASSKRATSHVLVDDTRPSLSRRKAYARQLCRVIACHATDEETRLLTRALEDVSAAILSRRYCPGLNTASYQAYAELGLQGGAQ